MCVCQSVSGFGLRDQRAVEVSADGEDTDDKVRDECMGCGCCGLLSVAASGPSNYYRRAADFYLRDSTTDFMAVVPCVHAFMALGNVLRGWGLIPQTSHAHAHTHRCTCPHMDIHTDMHTHHFSFTQGHTLAHTYKHKD